MKEVFSQQFKLIAFSEHIKEEVQRLVSETKGTRMMLMTAEHNDRTVEMCFEERAAGPLQGRARLEKSLENPEQVDVDANNVQTGTSAVVVYHDGNTDMDNSRQMERRSEQDVTQMEQMREEDFLLIAGHVWIQQRASSFAIKVIELWSADVHGNAKFPHGFLLQTRLGDVRGGRYPGLITQNPFRALYVLWRRTSTG